MAADGGTTTRTTANAIQELSERLVQVELGQAQILGRLDAMSTQMTATCAAVAKQADTLTDHEKRILLREVAYHERIEPAMMKLDTVILRLEAISAQVGRGALNGGLAGGGIAGGSGLAIGIIGKVAGWW
jgi:hypothetical protein